MNERLNPVARLHVIAVIFHACRNVILTGMVGDPAAGGGDSVQVLIEPGDGGVRAGRDVMAHQLCPQTMNAVYLANYAGDFRFVLLLRLRNEVGSEGIVGNIEAAARGILPNLILQLRVCRKVKAVPWHDFDVAGADFGDPFDDIINGHAAGVHRLIQAVRANS
ncbi:hypothetical protein D3C77_559680 [compost metagenome]